MSEIQILFENRDIVIINKPAGLVVHSDGRTQEPTVASWFVQNYPESAGVGEPLLVRHANEEKRIDRPGVVHRLDRDTSGVMVLARTQESFEFLKKAFQERTVEKTYLALVWGNIKEEEGVIDEPIGKSRSDIRQWQAGRGARGQMREAVTAFSVLKRFEENGEYFCLVEARPKTGRTHQIRVHMKYIHHPIVADPIYSGKRGGALGVESLALHAWKLQIPLRDGKTGSFEAEPPEAIKTLAKDIFT
jgi:23S rRNA pseudouridine1911/1915/1917 synthase